MGAIRVGDVVFDQNGEPTLVEWISQIETKLAYRLDFDNHSSIVASGTHQWLVRNYSARKHEFKPKVRTTDELIEGGLIRLAPNNHRPFANWSIASPAPIQCPEQILPMDPYVLGAWLGDGTSAQASITNIDEEVFAEIGARGIAVGEPRNMRRKIGGYGEILSTLRTLEVYRNKHIPPIYLRSSISQRLDLLRGLMDTDGYVDSRGHMSFSNTNKALIDGFVELVASFGMSYRIREKRAKLYGKDCGPCWEVYFQTKWRAFNLPRKAQRQQPEKFSARSENIYIRDIQPVGERKVRCISVASPSHVYLAGEGMVPTHNSTLLAMRFLKNWIEDRIKHPKFGDGMGAPLLYWLVAASYGETIKEFTFISQALIDIFGDGFVKASKRVDPGYIELYSTDEQGNLSRRPVLRLETKSATDITKLSKDSPHGVMMCEAAQMAFSIYERCRGRVTPMDGWMLLAGTLEQEMGAWFRELGMAWENGANNRKSFQLPSYTNVELYQGGRNDPKILAAEREQSDEWFLERIEGKPVPPRGLVFASEFKQDIHIQPQEYIPDLPVYIFEDPGYGSELSHAHAIEVFQLITDYLPNGQPYEQLRGIFESYVHGRITADIIDSLMTHDWWKSPKFVYSDPWYKDQHHSMNSVAEVWLQKTGLVPGPDHRILVMPGIERMKSFLKVDPLTSKPRITFDPSQKGIISEFGVGQNPLDGKYHPYRWKMDSEGTVYGQIPEQRYNDGISGTICGLVGKFGYGFANPGQKRVARQQRW